MVETSSGAVTVVRGNAAAAAAAQVDTYGAAGDASAVARDKEEDEEDMAAVMEEEEVIDLGEIPSYLPSDVGVDYVPLATLLSTGAFEEADAFTRDALIRISGPEAVKRAFCYWTEAKVL